MAINAGDAIKGIVAALPNITETESKMVMDFLNGSGSEGMELLNNPPLYQSAIGTTVGFQLELFRDWDFKNPLENAGIIRKGSNIGFSLQRIYNYEGSNQPDDPVFLKGPHNSNGAPLVPTKKTWSLRQKFVPVNFAWMMWDTIWDDMYFSNITADGGNRLMIINAIVGNMHKKYRKHVYAMQSMLIAYGYDTTILKDSQILNINLGASDYLQITGTGALNLTQDIDNILNTAATIGYADFNEESFQEYWNEGDYVIAVRKGLKSAIRRTLMANNYFSPAYVQEFVDRLVELPVPFSPCNYKVKADATIPDPDHQGQTIPDPNRGATLYPVYSADNRDTTYAGNGVVLGLSTVAGQTGASSVQYYFGSDNIEYVETDTSVFGMIIDKNRLNWITGPGGELSSEITVRDAFKKCHDIIFSTFGVNAEGNKIGSSIFVERSYPVIYLKNSFTN